MIEPLQKDVVRLSRRRVHGRVVNAVADLLRRELRVPEIYLEPRISATYRPDILAVDQAGSGDTHAVDVRAMSSFPTKAELRFLLKEAMNLPFHFRYIAMPTFAADFSDPYLRFAEYGDLFDPSGIGRIGIISFSSQLLEPTAILDRSVVRLTVRPERFRVRDEKREVLERFLAKATPDMEVRI